MRLRFSTLLALRQLQHLGWGMLGKFAGVCVAIVLVFVQIGFQNALLDSVLQLDRALDADVVMVGPQFQTIGYSPPWFPRDAAYQASAVDDVISVRWAYIFIGQLRDPSTGVPIATRFVGFDPAAAPFRIQDLEAQRARLALPNTALLDRLSRQQFKPVVQQLSLGEEPVTLYIQSPASTLAPRVEVVGTFGLGPDFALAGNVITSDLNFYRFFQLPMDRISIATVRIREGADPEAVRDRIAARVGGAAQVHVKDAFVAAERRYFNSETPIGVLFGFGIAIGILIGVVFVFEVLRGIIDLNLSEYAVLRAMGYQDRFFTALVLQIAGVITTLAFLPSLLVTYGLYEALGCATMLPFTLTGTVALGVLAAALAMSVGAVLFALRKLRRNNPIDLFS